MHDQAAGLRRKLEMNGNVKQAKTISIVSGKSGVGKSNIAINFSISLLRRQKKVLLIDLDVGMGNVDILLGLHASRTIIDMFNQGLSIHEITEKGPNGLAYISGGSACADFFTLDQAKMDYFLKQYEALVWMYDYIIFDMGAGVTSDSMFFVLASDECLVVTTQEPTSITDAYGMIKHIISNKVDMPIYVVLNRSLTQKKGIKVVEEFKYVVARFLQTEINLLGILPEDKTVTTAVIKQIPYVLLKEKAAVSTAMVQLVNTYLSFSTEKFEVKTPLSFVRKLKQLTTGR